MRHFYMILLLAAGIALSGACGGSTTNAARKAQEPSYGPIAPGHGEETAIRAGEDEIGSILIWATAGATFLTVGHDRTVCDLAGECTESPRCADRVTTRVCELDALDGEPRCLSVVLVSDEPVSVAVNEPYAGVEMAQGVCVDAVRMLEPLEPGRLWWRMPGPDHPRGWITDMAEGGGSPAPGGHTWYAHPVGGPR